MTDRITDLDLLALFADADEGTLSTPEVRQAIGYSRSGAWGRLNALAEAGGLLRWKTADGTATFWSITDRGRELLEGNDG